MKSHRVIYSCDEMTVYEDRITVGLKSVPLSHLSETRIVPKSVAPRWVAVLVSVAVFVPGLIVADKVDYHPPGPFALLVSLCFATFFVFRGTYVVELIDREGASMPAVTLRFRDRALAVLSALRLSVARAQEAGGARGSWTAQAPIPHRPIPHSGPVAAVAVAAGPNREVHVERQVIVSRCKFCEKLSPVDASHCTQCGAANFLR